MKLLKNAKFYLVLTIILALVFSAYKYANAAIQWSSADTGYHEKNYYGVSIPQTWYIHFDKSQFDHTVTTTEGYPWQRHSYITLKSDFINQLQGGGDADTLDGKDSTEFAGANHNHDSRYYTESEIDSKLSNLPKIDDTLYFKSGVTPTYDGYTLTYVRDQLYSLNHPKYGMMYFLVKYYSMPTSAGELKIR
ncbi:MAG: hypothetical protein H0Z35_07910 [Thermoanaerobacteraceae bacterium]|nr:hypothetical protein [Thermoanaerobacteraceae bacterium]